jgi:hypothetical protein
MAQGSHKTKIKLPSKKSSSGRVQQGKGTKPKSNTLEKKLKKKFETNIKKNIEEQLCQQAKSVEGGKSFHIIQSKK